VRQGNTPTICRKCYVHPDVLTFYLDGNLVLKIKNAVENELRDELSGLQPEERLSWLCCGGVLPD